MTEWLLVTAALMLLVLTLDHVVGQVGRAWDRWRRPYLYPTQRQYQAWRNTLQRHAPAPEYRLTTTRITEAPGRGDGPLPPNGRYLPGASATTSSEGPKGAGSRARLGDFDLSPAAAVRSTAPKGELPG